MTASGKGINVPHHPTWTMDTGEAVTKEFLGPATDLVDISSIFNNFLDGAAITDPIKVNTP